MNWKKRTALALAILIPSGGIFWMYQGKEPEEQAIVREREYTAKTDDITVGVNVTGKLNSETAPLEGIAGLVVRSFSVKPGDRVETGDKIGEYTMESLTQTLVQAAGEVQTAKEDLLEARTAQKDGLKDLVSRLSSEKDLNAGIYKAYVKCLNNLIDRLENDQASTRDKLYSDEKNTELQTRLAEIEGELEQVRSLLDTAGEARDAEKSEEKHSVSQTNSDLLGVDLLEYQVTLAEEVLTQKSEALKQLQALGEDPSIYIQTPGVIQSLDCETGEELKDHQPLVTISTGKNWEFTFPVEQNDIANIQKNQLAEFVSNAYPTDTLKGSVSRIQYQADDEGKFSVTVQVEDTPLELFEGMEGYGTVILTRKEDVLTLSNKAFYQKDGVTFVKLRTEDGGLEERQVTLGFSDGRVSQVMDGLSPGDVVVVVDEL